MIEKMPVHPQDMGETTSKVFAGEAESDTTRLMYAETPQFFAEHIRSRLSPNEKYTLADIGSAGGEMLAKLKEILSEYNFRMIGFDIDLNSLQKNPADMKVVVNAEQLPLVQGGVDVAVMRYVLQWNNPERQREILREMSRVAKKFVLIEHIGADSIDADGWRDRTDDLLDGEEIVKLKRGEHYLSSSNEIEGWMMEAGIQFERLRERRIEEAVNAYSERYSLSKSEIAEARKILGDKNYFIQTDWIIFPTKDGE